MARKKKHEEHENHERWLVSYADFITLLFAFFVVMYSISSVNEGKYRVLSDSLIAAFRTSARALDPIQVGELARSPRSTVPAFMDAPQPLRTLPPAINLPFHRGGEEAGLGANEWMLDEAARQVEEIAQDVEQALEELILEGVITLHRDRLWLEVEINTSILFGSASAQPSLDAEFVLKRLAALLVKYPNPIHVEGFTDNLPISSGQFPSNWELSAARSAAVVRLFASYGVQPARLAAIGFGEHRPVADNATEMGRARNRRVVVVIVADLGKEGGEGDFSEFEILSQREAQRTGAVALAAPETSLGDEVPVDIVPVRAPAPAADTSAESRQTREASSQVAVNPALDPPPGFREVTLPPPLVVPEPEFTFP